MDPGLNKNEPELAILVLPVPLQMLAHRDSLLDQEVQVLGNLRSETAALQDTQDLAACDRCHLGDTMAITQQHTNLAGGHTLLGQLADVLGHLAHGKV